MKYSVYTDKGMVRARNEDSCFAATVGPDAFFAAVCDGMGGERAGDLASDTAIGEIAAAVMAGAKDLSRDAAARLLREAVSRANAAVYEKAASDPELSGMGTTVAAALACGDSLTVIHAGDSRAYLADGDGIRQITRDHSFVRRLVDEGLITEEQALTHPDKNLITSALGVQRELVYDVNTADFPSGAVCLLCSDGLTNYVGDEELSEIIGSVPIENCARVLVERANAAGGGDNITAVVFKNDSDNQVKGDIL